MVAEEIKKLSEQSAVSTSKIDEILKEIVSIVQSTRETMSHNSAVVSESAGKLNITVDVFKTMIESSKEVVGVIGELSRELKNISDLKENMHSSMEKLADISENAAESTKEISTSTEEQVISVESVMAAMESVQKSIDNLSKILHEKVID